MGYSVFRDLQPAGTGATQETLTSQSSNPRTSGPSSTVTSGSTGPPCMPKAMVSGSSRSSSTAQTSSTGQATSTQESTPPEPELIREVRYVKRGTDDTITSSSSATRSSAALRPGQDAAERTLSLGYTARMQSFERRGEVMREDQRLPLPQLPHEGDHQRDVNEEAWQISLRDEGLLPAEVGSLPLWMGVSTRVMAACGSADEDPDSEDSFQLWCMKHLEPFLWMDEKTCPRGMPAAQAGECGCSSTSPCF